MGHTVLAVKLDKCKIGRQWYSNTYRFLIELSRYIIVICIKIKYDSTTQTQSYIHAADPELILLTKSPS